VAVKLRLMRMGKKKQPTYRIVVADGRSPRDGKFIEVIGTYAPKQDPAAITVNNSKASDWLLKGAQPTETVKKLLELSGAWEEYSKAKGVAYKSDKVLRVATKADKVADTKTIDTKTIDTNEALEAAVASSDDIEVES